MKLSLDALRLRAEAVASNDLLATISGGVNNDCHDTPEASTPAAPATTTIAAPKTSWEANVDIKYDTNTGGVIIGGGVKVKF